MRAVKPFKTLHPLAAVILGAAANVLFGPLPDLDGETGRPRQSKAERQAALERAQDKRAARRNRNLRWAQAGGIQLKD